MYYQRRMSNTHLQLGKHRHEISHIDMKGPLWPLLSPLGAVAFNAFGEDKIFTVCNNQLA